MTTMGVGATEEISALQRDLRELGFWIVPTPPTGTWDTRTEQAVREFQIHAGMQNIARATSRNSPSQRWLDHLEPVINDDLYTGPVNGIADARVLQLIAHWRQQNFRCPVVVEAYLLEAGSGRPHRLIEPEGNLWAHDHPALTPFRPRKSPTVGLFVCDLTGHFVPLTGTDVGNMIPMGTFTAFAGGYFGGAVTKRHLRLEVLPETVVGKSWAALSEAERSMFRTIRAISENECLGYFDCLNGYDNAWMSFGPFHWTLALGPNDHRAPKTTPGELPPFLAMVAGRHPNVFQQVFGRFGVGIEGTWPSGSAGTDFARSWAVSRTYNGRLVWQRRDPADGKVREQPVSLTADLDWFKTFPWFWRILAGIRRYEALRRMQWDMARLRLRDLLNMHWNPFAPPGPPATSGTTIGEIYTSEKAVAMLVRLHVRYSSSHLDYRETGKPWRPGRLRRAFTLSGVTGPPSTWTHAEERRLIDGLIGVCARAELDNKTPVPPLADLLKRTPRAGGLFEQLRLIDRWPDSLRRRGYPYRLDPTVVGQISERRGSFKSHYGDLPGEPAGV